VLKFKENLEKITEEQKEKLGYPPALVYVDESAIKEEVTRVYADGVLLHPRNKGRSSTRKGARKKTQKNKYGRCGKWRGNTCPFYLRRNDGGGATPQDSHLFNAYLCLVLLPLVPFGAIIIMDNARYHLSEGGGATPRNQRTH
jgi:hypothetical protein